MGHGACSRGPRELATAAAARAIPRQWWLLQVAIACLAGCGPEPAPVGGGGATTDSHLADAQTEPDSASVADAIAGTDAAAVPDSSPEDAAPDAHDADQDLATPADSQADAAISDAAALPSCTTASDCAAPGYCWIGHCNSNGSCGYAPKATGSPCDDGNACTLQDSCAGGQCAGAGAANCDDAAPCTADSCHPLAGCIHLPVAASSACDDGNPCTHDDVCSAGSCQPGVQVCQCEKQGDCAAFEDGNLCNGLLYCDKSAGPPYLCKVNPATIVQCPAAFDSACQTNKCLPATGVCQLVVAPLNTPCDDGKLCTTGDHCQAGLCLGGTDTCACQNDAACAAQEDGNQCNGTLFCNKATSACQVNPATVVKCHTSDDTACQLNTCNPKSGKCQLLPIAQGQACDDGNPCTPNESCQAGDCSAANNTCECQKDSDCKAKDDGNPCNGTLYCDLKVFACKVNPATLVECSADGDGPCEWTACEPATGKCATVTLPKDGSPCDDGNPCTASSSCLSGKCESGVNICACQLDADCAAQEDGNLCNGKLFCNPKTKACAVNPATLVVCPSAFDEVCAANQCNPATGACGFGPANQGNQCTDGSICSAGGWCKDGTCAVEGTIACECTKDSDCAKFEDGDLCNGTLYCDKLGSKPSCKLNPATVVVCPSGGGACAASQCDPKSGSCAKVALNGLCQDGLACTIGDACQDGLCKGSPKSCVDSQPCTTDSCQEPFGCLYLPTSITACDDGNACTAGDHCLGGGCVGTQLSCDDGNPCTADSCHASAGCLAKPHSGACSDQDACTFGDSCSGGACLGGLAIDCDDDDLCTQDVCEKASGKCVHVDIGTKSCDDNNACTQDICGAASGCTYEFSIGKCSDGNPCTAGDACKGGKCQPGKPFLCNDAEPCTDDSCSASSGCVYAPNLVACDDGNACTGGDACKGGACLGGSAKDCQDGNPCTLENCNPATGACEVTATTVSCDDGNACTSFDQCAKGVCAGKVIECSDGNPCTDDSCDPKGGCAHANNSASCALNSCTLATCQAGTCTSGTIPKYFQSQIKAATKSDFLAGSRQLVALPGGTLGFTAGDSCGGGIGTVTAAGQVTMECGGCGQGFYCLHQRNGTMVWPDNYNNINVFQPGTGGYDKSCGTSSKVVFPTLKYIYRMVDWGNGYFAVGYSQSAAGTAYAHKYGAILLGPDFKAVWAWTAGNAVVDAGQNSTTLLSGAAVLAQGTAAAAVGVTRPGTSPGGESLAVISVMDLGGFHTETVIDAGDSAVLHDVLALPTGGFVAAGSKRAAGQPLADGWLVWFDATGKVTAERIYGDEKGNSFSEIERLSDGTLVMTGATGVTTAGEPYDGWLMATDPWGNLRWQRTLPIFQASLTSLVVQSDDSLAAMAVNYPPGGTTRESFVMRRDAWGFASCAQAGLCGSLSPANCADLDPCTIDSCHPTLGCTHSAMPAGSPCGIAMVCNAKGVCL